MRNAVFLCYLNLKGILFMNKKLISLLVCLPLLVNAEESNKVSIGAGFGDYNLDEYFGGPTLLGWNAGHYSIFYTHNYSDDRAVDIGYLDANKGKIFEINLLLISGSKYFLLTERNEIFIRVGLNYYQYEMRRTVGIEQDGVGYL